MSRSLVYNARKIVITGCIAVGKSSVVQAVQNVLTSKSIKWVTIPEYIDYREDGLEMLQKYLNHTITALEFQSYIYDCRENYLENLKLHGDEVLIFERGPDDGITYFSNYDNQQGMLSDLDYYKLYERARNMDIKFNIPSYFVKDSYYYVGLETSDATQIGRLIESVLGIVEHSNFIIGLYNDDETCYKRMLKRNRNGESSGYSRENIAACNKHYKKLYNILQSKKNLRFVDLGKLI